MAIEMFKRGSVEMLALLILNEDDAHGYRIVQEIKDRSDGRLIIKEGSLYPILYKLSDEGYIISQEDISETKLGRKRIRVIYSITPYRVNFHFSLDKTIHLWYHNIVRFKALPWLSW